jgi:hypothetical protein
VYGDLAGLTGNADLAGGTAAVFPGSLFFISALLSVLPAASLFCIVLSLSARLCSFNRTNMELKHPTERFI